MGRRSILAALVSAALATAATPVMASATPPPTQAPPPLTAATPAERTALTEARETGEPVEVADAGTESALVFANPDSTFTMRAYASPQRVRRDGKWKPVDTTLQVNLDGTLSPVASTVDMRLSGGGDGPVITLSSGEKKVGFSWPVPLPAPAVEANRATYRDVVAGVDLVVSATAQGYTHVVVVRDAAAAANPLLAGLTLRGTAQGLALDVDDSGIVTARDPDGRAVFGGSTPVMWGSARPDERAPAPTATDPGAAKLTRVKVTGRKSARTAGALDLSIVPDQAALTGPGVAYPVYIDPQMSGGQQAWAEVTANGWKYYNADMDAQVGRCYNREGHCGSLTLARSYFKIDTAPLQARNGVTATVFDAKMWFTQTWGSHLCVAEPVNLYGTGYFDGGITWSNQPLGSGAPPAAMDTRSSGAGAQCNGAGGVMFDNANVKSYAQSSANNSWPNVHFALGAPDEGNDLQWKKFATKGTAAPHFDVVFSFRPNAAGGLSVSRAVSCTGTAVTPDARPTLYASATDNNSSPLTIGLHFEVWDTAHGSMKSSGAVEVGSGTVGGWTIPTALGDGTYDYRVAVYNVFPGDSNRNLWNGTWSSWYRFTIQATPPAAPTFESVVDYPADYWGAAQGAAGAIAVSAGGNTVGYAYTFNGSGTQPVPNTGNCDYTPTGSTTGGWIPNGSVGVDWIPIPANLTPGYHTLYVRAFDAAHNMSAESARHVFYVAPNTGQTTKRFEAESLPRSQPTGQSRPLGPQANCCATTWSGGNQLLFQGSAAGQSFTVDFTVDKKADYQVAIGLTKANDHGQVSFHLDGTQIGQQHLTAPIGTFDAHNSAVINSHQPLGIHNLAVGTHTLKVTVTGTNSQSVGARYLAGLDHITLTSTSRYEAENPAAVTPSQPAGQTAPIQVETQNCCNNGPYSQSRQLAFRATAAGQSVDLGFTIPFEADYALGVTLGKWSRYGKVKITVDGAPLVRTDTAPWDGYAAGSTGRTVYVPLGGAHLSAGAHRLTLTVVGKNDQSTGFEVGVDYLSVVPINGITAADFTDAMNNKGYAVDNVSGADMDFSGRGLSTQSLTAAGLTPGTRVTYGGATFTMPARNATTGNDNVVALGQTIPLPAHQQVKASSIGLLAVSTCGTTAPTTGTVTYTDGTTSNPFFPSVQDWITGDKASAAVELSHWDVGAAPGTGKPKVYAIFAPTDPTKTIASVTLPNSGTSFLSNTCAPVPALHVLAMAPQPVAEGWLGAWASPIDQTQDKSSAGGVTMRMVVHPMKTGTTMRIRLSNTKATVPAQILHATVAAQTGEWAVAAGTPTPVTFGGNANVTIPAGGDVYSDPVAFPATTGGTGNLLVSLHLPPSVPQASTNITGNNMTFDAPGDATANVDGVPYGDQWSSIYGNTYYLSGIEVSTNDPAKGTVAVLSDDWYSYGGPGAQIWPTWVDYVADNLGDTLPGGIAQTGFYGADAPSPVRHRSTLSQPNLRTVLVDQSRISSSDTLGVAQQRLKDLIKASSPTGLKRYYRTDGSPLRVVLATIAPQNWAPTDSREILRRALNDDIRANYADYGADDIVDFDEAVRDPAAANKIDAQYFKQYTNYWVHSDAFDRRLAQYIADDVNGLNGFPPLEF